MRFITKRMNESARSSRQEVGMCRARREIVYGFAMRPAPLSVPRLEPHEQGEIDPPPPPPPPSGGFPGRLAWWERGAAAWAELVAGVLRPGFRAGLCSQMPVEGPASTYLFILVHGEERGPGDKLWVD
ncbi:hypothetical protein NDU88_002507 [Pleurodeles waltl]|uniref:Uncharacterized protein n=1 Tax=Pleurodeles waltl TaxID=8319 RepID=A0AAV7T3H8_PLEWA|nr:hypothetical protein NDU88_002507 [Pleurodeles waltl]